MTKKKKLHKHNKWGYLFLIPFFTVYLIFQLYPMFYSLALSFTDNKGFNNSMAFNNFANYTYLFESHVFWQTFSNTFIIFIMNFIPQIIFALFFAQLLTSTAYKLKGQQTFRLIYYMPNIITAASVAVMFYSLFIKPDGILYQMFVNMGIFHEDYNLYMDPWPSRIIVAFIQFWMWFGNSMLIFIAGISGINPSVFEAAKVDGAGPFKTFGYITLPLLKPILLYSFMTSMIGGLQMFDIPYLFLGGGPNLGNGANATETIAVYIFNTAFGSGGEYNYGLASAASVYLFVLALFLSILMFRLFNSKKSEGKK